MQTTANGIQVKFSCRPFKIDENILSNVITNLLNTLALANETPDGIKVIIEDLVDEYIQKYIIDTWHVEEITRVDPE